MMLKTLQQRKLYVKTALQCPQCKQKMDDRALQLGFTICTNCAVIAAREAEERRRKCTICKTVSVDPPMNVCLSCLQNLR